MNTIVSNVEDFDKHNLTKHIKHLLTNNTLNSEILFYLIKSFMKHRCSNLSIPDIYALCGFYIKKKSTCRAYFIYICAILCFIVQILIPFRVIFNTYSLDICEPSDDIILKISGVIMYQTLFVGRISTHIVPDLLPSYSFSSYWGTLSMFIHSFSEIMIHILTFLIFMDEDEGRNILSFILNALAMQYILQMNCVPYILDEDEDKIINEMKVEMLKSFILKSEKTNASSFHKKIQKITTIILIICSIGISSILGHCL